MIIVYSMEGCASCVQAASILQRKGVAFKVVKIDEDFDAADFIQSRGHRSMPQIYVAGEEVAYLGDYKALTKLTEAEWEALKKA